MGHCNHIVTRNKPMLDKLSDVFNMGEAIRIGISRRDILKMKCSGALSYKRISDKEGYWEKTDMLRLT